MEVEGQRMDGPHLNWLLYLSLAAFIGGPILGLALDLLSWAIYGPNQTLSRWITVNVQNRLVVAIIALVLVGGPACVVVHLFDNHAEEVPHGQGKG